MRDYVKAFRQNWGRTLLAGWMALGVLLLSLFGIWFYPRVVAGSAGLIAAAVLSVIVILDAAAMIHLFVMIAFTDLSVRRLMRNSLLLALMDLPRSVAVLAVIAAIVAANHLGGVWFAWLMPLIGFSVMGLICVYVGWGALRRHVIVEDNGHPQSDSV